MSRYSIYKNKILESDKSFILNFNPDSRRHYVYRVTDYTRIIEENYYGSRTTKKDNIIEDFWDYRTSSKYNTILLENKENYKIKIIKVFNNPGDKILYEAFLHQYFNVKLHSNFWNKSNQTPFGFDTTGNKEISNKMVETRKNKDSFKSGGVKCSLTKSSQKWKDDVGLKSIIKTQNKKSKIILIEGQETSMNKEGAKRATATKNKKIVLKDGSTSSILKESEKKRIRTINKPIINSSGDDSTILKETLKKSTKTRNKKIILKDGTITSIAKEASKKAIISKIKTSRTFNIYHIEKGLVEKGVLRKDIIKISQGLLKTSKEEYLGFSRESKLNLNRHKNLLLMGLYVEEI